MTWGDDIALKLLDSAVPAAFDTCLAIWETPASPCPLITLQALKDALGITDSSQDAELSRLINVYSQAVENFVERQLCSGAREAVFVARPQCTVTILPLPQFPVASVDYFDIDGNVIDPAELVVDGNRGAIIAISGGTWNIGRYAHVKYTAGYATIPADIQDAMVQMIGQALTSSGSSATVGPLKSQRVEGAVTESYYDPRTAGADTSSGSGIVGRYASTLDYYRGERAFV